MTQRWLAAWGVASLALPLLNVAAVAAPPLPTGPLKDWPCDAPWVETLDAASLYGATLPAPLPQAGAWQADAAVRPVVDFAASTENGAKLGAEKIATLATASGGRRRETLLLVLSGVVERANFLRDIIYHGIGDQVVKSRLVAEQTAANDKAAAAFADDGSNAAAQRKKEFETARFWNRRSLGEAADSAELLCHRLAYAETKTRSLAAAVRALLEQP